MRQQQDLTFDIDKMLNELTLPSPLPPKPRITKRVGYYYDENGIRRRTTWYDARRRAIETRVRMLTNETIESCKHDGWTIKLERQKAKSGILCLPQRPEESKRQETAQVLWQKLG